MTGRSGRGAGPSTPFYFGPKHRRYGLLTWPEGPVRAAAVICPPLTYEAVTSHHGLRVLADQLAAAGIVALRIDYAGSGNAPESERGGADVSDWTQTVTDAVDTVRGWGISTVITVGVRFGAGIALASAADQPVEYAVLWDPIPSGRRYVRAVKMLAALTATSAASEDGNAGGVTIAGIEFSDAVLKGMGKINITPTAPPGLDAGAAPSHHYRRVARRSGGCRSGHRRPSGAVGLAVADVMRLPGTAERSTSAQRRRVVPTSIVDRIVGWIGERDLGPTQKLERPTDLATSTVEQFRDVELTAPSAADRAGRAARRPTEITGSAPDRALLMLNNGSAPNIGPGRIWVDWAADYARDGGRALRLDMSGLGESRARDPRDEQTAFRPLERAHATVFTRAVNLDVADAVEQLRSTGARAVTVLGLCSGATLGFRAVDAGVPIDRIVSINPELHSPFSYYRTDLRRGYHRLLPRIFAVPLYKRPLFELLDRVPAWIWGLLERLHLVRTPARLPMMAVTADVPTLMIFGEGEWGLRGLRRRDPRRLAILEASPKMTIEVLGGLDHSMFDLDARGRVQDVVQNWLGVVSPALRTRSGSTRPDG